MTEIKIKNIIRVLNTDIEGIVPLDKALRKVHGINFSISNAICKILNFDKHKKVGSLTPEEIKLIEDLIKTSNKRIPSWLLNRRKDFDTGEDLHLTTTDLKLKKDFDIKRMKKIKCYKGVRHMQGLPVRGQRTKGHFRKGKSVGVTKKSVVKKSAPKAGGKK